ncbi:MAG TPA: hypothetical protein VGM10_22070 [Actinocrinis sp.]
MSGRDPEEQEQKATRRHAAAKPAPGVAQRVTPRGRRPTVEVVVLSTAAVLMIIAVSLLAAKFGSGGGIHASGAAAGASATAGKTPSKRASASASASASSGLTPSASMSPSSDPGLLPQTDALPSSDDPQFQAGVQALWQAIVQNQPSMAHGFFFPLSAYLQVKDISDPTEDYQDRLLTWYDLDIAAAHDMLGADAASATLVGVQVPTDQAVWITPGVEYNKGSYYRVYGTRLTYQEDGQTASFGIFSLISWRGEWYVVHLGPSTRSSNVGIVYDPEG